MRTQQFYRIFATAGTLALAACGGSGSRVASTSTPATTPLPNPPPAAPAVRIFATPTVGEYASVGASISGPGGNLDTYTSKDARFGTVSTGSADQAHIRYTPGGYYEAKLAGSDWDRLVHYKGIVDPSSDNNYFQPQSVPQNYAFVITRNSRNDGYLYSELAGWGSSADSRWGYVAFGLPTPAGSVPKTGSAQFKGVVSGNTDIMVADHLYGGYFPLSVDGTVSLNFDFGAGNLAGAMDLYLPVDGMNPRKLGTFTFTDTVFSTGSTTYSGSFDTAVAGQNFFLGQFTGPNANETIGAWALPFIFSTGGDAVPADGLRHQAFGAWIAKRGN